jgi:hypothetical protein
LEFILICLLNNCDVIALIIYTNEVTSIMFKGNQNPGYVDDKIDYKTDLKNTLKSILL